MSGREWRLDLPWTAPPLTLNPPRHGHWSIQARKKQAVRQVSKRLAVKHRIPQLERIVIELHYAPRDKRRRDPLNLVATLKPIEDGIVDAGVVPDDTPEFVVPTMPVIDAPAGADACLYVVVREVLS